MAAGEMTQVGLTEFLKTSFERLTAFSTNELMHFICMDWRHLQEVLDGAG